MRKRARAAVGRSLTETRVTAVLLGAVLLAVGTLVALLSYGVFGTGRAGRPLLDPVVVDALRAHPVPARLIAIAAGLLMALLGVIVAARAVRPQRHPDLVLDAAADTSILVRATAVGEAVGTQAAQIAGVDHARVRVVGTAGLPAFRVDLRLTDGTDVAEVIRSLEAEVLTVARASLGLDALPVAVRVELAQLPPQRRVA